MPSFFSELHHLFFERRNEHLAIVHKATRKVREKKITVQTNRNDIVALTTTDYHLI